jgi:hypothetical protein
MKNLEDFKKRAKRFVHYENEGREVIYYPSYMKTLTGTAETGTAKYYECIEAGHVTHRVHTKKDAVKFLEG